jgi:formylmethanofuran dehydrogenase subunit E-like metal-binding protein
MRLKYQRIITLVLTILAIVTVPSFAAADASSWQERLKQGLDKGMTELAVKRGSPDLCVLTNAPYVKYRGESAIGCLDTVQEATGCSQGKKNLLSYHAAVSKPLRIVLFNKKSGDGVVLTLCRGDRLTEPCSPVEASASGDGLARVKLLLGGEKILEADAYRKVMKKLGPSDAFSITSILNAWAACAPFDFLKACEFHNHYCPGVTSGALMARLINEKYPLEKGQK